MNIFGYEEIVDIFFFFWGGGVITKYYYLGVSFPYILWLFLRSIYRMGLFFWAGRKI